MYSMHVCVAKDTFDCYVVDPRSDQLLGMRNYLLSFSCLSLSFPLSENDIIPPIRFRDFMGNG